MNENARERRDSFLIRLHKDLMAQVRRSAQIAGLRPGAFVRRVFEDRVRKPEAFELNLDTYSYKLTRDPTRKDAAKPFRLSLNVESKEFLLLCAAQQKESLSTIVASILLDYYGKD